ncbi:MAG: hypothetical protein ACK5KQ_06845 [Anaerorhabdus sp.]
MKKIMLIFMIILIAGCSGNKQLLERQLVEKLDNVSKTQAISANNQKAFYSYYLEPSVGRRKVGKTYNIFIKDNLEFAMNLNIPFILTKEESENKSYDIEPIMSYDGSYVDINNQELEFKCNIYQNRSHSYIEFNTKYMNFYASGSLTEVVGIADNMLTIAKSVTINEDRILTAYSAKEIVEFEKEQLKLYEVMIPENGRIEEMMVNGSETGNGSLDFGGEYVDGEIDGETTDEIDGDAHDTYE